ncbi:MAG: archaetidylserine decarboxylase [Halioglobus sp.]
MRLIHSLSRQEQLNFLLTNRIPRRLATQVMGWLSSVESPRLTRLMVRIWQWFADDLDLDEAREREFRSLQDCFTRQLREGARPIAVDPDIVVSPCDAIVGMFGDIQGTTAFQAKGFPYDLQDLIPDSGLRDTYRNGRYVTLRLKSSMYHRFHAPLDCRISEVTYISGDTWNVNPIALKRIEKLYCRNERAVIQLDTGRPGSPICLVPVAAILVASIRLHFLDTLLSMHYRGPRTVQCNASFSKGDELGYFQHGSTIILFATPDYAFCQGLRTGERVQMGQPLLSFARKPLARGTTSKPQQPIEVIT